MCRYIFSKLCLEKNSTSSNLPIKLYWHIFWWKDQNQKWFYHWSELWFCAIFIFFFFGLNIIIKETPFLICPYTLAAKDVLGSACNSLSGFKYRWQGGWSADFRNTLYCQGKPCSQSSRTPGIVLWTRTKPDAWKQRVSYWVFDSQ